MGQFALPPRGSSYETDANQDGASRTGHTGADTTAGSGVVADSETRRVLGLLRQAMERLPE